MVATQHYDLDSDTLLGGASASDLIIPSQKAIKTYVDNNSGVTGANTDLSNLTANGEAHFQAPLVSGTNIKTINNTSLLGSGNISINADNIFWATYGTTTFTDIMTAINAGKLVLCRVIDSISNYDIVYTYRSHTDTTIEFYNVSSDSNTLIGVDSSNNWNLTNCLFLPDQTSQSGKFLTTDGYSASWSTVSIPTVDQTFDGTSTNAQSGVAIAGELTKYALTSSLATVATSGSYTDLDNKPTIPTVNNATLTIQKNGTNVKTFTANASSDVTANITVPTSISDLTDDTSTTPIDKADTLTGLTASIEELNYIDGVTSNIQTQIDGKVNKSGDTMTGDLTIARTGTSIAQILKSDTYEAGTTPSETITHQYLFRDKNDETLGYLSHHSFDDGVVRVTMNCRNQDASANEYISVGYTATGNVYTHAPTPANSSNDKNIATTEFVKNTNHGEWVIANHTIMEDVSLKGSTNLTYNLSSYLPNDGNIYEVLIVGTVTSNANSQVDLQVSALTSYMYVAYARSVTNNTITGVGTSMLLARSNTTINVRRNSAYNGTARLYCRAYRRVTY